MLINLFCLIYYVTSSISIIPSIVRVIRRKSSTDCSKAGTMLCTIGTISWSLYIFLTLQTTLVYIGTVFDLILQIVWTFLVFKYHNKEEIKDNDNVEN